MKKTRKPSPARTAKALKREGKSDADIAQTLNERGFARPDGHPFTHMSIWRLLKPQVYVKKTKTVDATPAQTTQEPKTVKISELFDSIQVIKGLTPDARQRVISFLLDSSPN